MSKLRVIFDTGTAWTKEIIVEGNYQSDILGLVEEYVMNNPEEFRKYSHEELMEIYEDEEEVDNFTPINGGEYYTDIIVAIHEVK